MTIRLALLVDSPSKRAYGSIASRMALGLSQLEGIETTIVCYGDDPAPDWLPASVRVDRLGIDRASRALIPLMRYLQAEQPDVLVTRMVHANLLGVAAARLARLPPRWRGKLIVAQDHLVELSSAANWKDNKWLVRATYRYADGVLAESPAVRENIIGWCRLDPTSVYLLPLPINGVTGDLGDVPHPWLRPGQPPVFVSAAALVSWKRMDLLVDAFGDLRQRHDARMLIIGKGPMRPHLDEQIRRAGLGTSAATLGWVDDPRAYSSRAQAFVLASDEEGFAQVLTEAMSVGCPVITTDAQGGGPRFVTDDGKYGVLVPRGDRAGLAEAMERLLVDDVRAHYADLGRRRIEDFSPAKCASLLLEHVSAVLGTPERV